MVDKDPIHEEFRRAQNNYSMMIWKTKEEHWIEWLEILDDEGVWTTNWMVSGAATDGVMIFPFLFILLYFSILIPFYSIWTIFPFHSHITSP